MATKLFYFSGTGNSQMLAQELGQLLEDAQAVDLAHYDCSVPVEADRVGFVFPVYYWGLPNLVHRFLAEVKLPAGAYCFAIVVMGGSSGAALPLVDSYLQKQGLSLKAGWSVLMPDSYILLMGPPAQEKQEALIAAARWRLPAMAGIIRDRQSTTLPKYNPAVNAFHQHFRKGFGKKDGKFQASSACTGCGLCAQVCPVENIVLTDGCPTWQHHCELCMACIQRCPAHAISAGGATEKRDHYYNPYV